MISLPPNQICEACERLPADKVEPCDNPRSPYLLCPACLVRIHARALRPIEWYNLAKRHGWYQHLLHDDFYNEDGEADQPNVDVESPENFPAPTLMAVSGDPISLLDYSITRWHLKPEVITAWSALPRADVIRALVTRFSSSTNVSVRSRVLEICAACLGEYGADFVRYAWGEYPQTAEIYSLAKASVACLPIREGFDRVISALSDLDGTKKRNKMSALGYFHSPETLDWIEKNFFEPTTDSWGWLAAASHLNWPRVARWIEGGRPFSLVALDALMCIVRPQGPRMQEYKPRLHQPPSGQQLEQTLSAYARIDPVPRVQKSTTYLITNVTLLTPECD
jgi:hypothetical protein